MLCCEFAHLTRPDNRDGLTFKRIENLFGEFNGGVTDRNSTGSDCCLGTDTFANAESFGEKTIENRPRTT